MDWALTVDSYARVYPGWTEPAIERTRQSTLDRLPIIWALRREAAGSASHVVESQNLAQAVLATKTKGRWR